MSAETFGAAALSILATLGMVGNVVLDNSDQYANIQFNSMTEGVLREQWPVTSGTLSMAHVDGQLTVFNALQSIVAEEALDVCFTSSTAVDVLGMVQRWTERVLLDGVRTRLHIVVEKDQRSSRDTQLFLRKLYSAHKDALTTYVEVVLPSSWAFDGLLTADDVRLLVFRDVCGGLLQQKSLRSTSRGILVVDLSNGYPSSHRLGFHFDSGTWHVTQPQRRYSMLSNNVSSQHMSFAVLNDVTVKPEGGSVILFDAHNSWMLERLRLGERVFFAAPDIAIPVLRLWSSSTSQLVKLSRCAGHAYAMFMRHLLRSHSAPTTTLVRLFDFGFTVARESDVTFPKYAECAVYRLEVLEPHVVVSTEAPGGVQKKSGMIGRLALTVQATMEQCDRRAASGEVLQVCQPQVTRRYEMRDRGDQEPSISPYRTVVPLFAPEGCCLYGGAVSLTQRRTYGSFSEYAFYPLGFDGYDGFSLLDGVVEGDTQLPALVAPSEYNPRDLPDEDRVRVMPTLVPVRLKKAK